MVVDIVLQYVKLYCAATDIDIYWINLMYSRSYGGIGVYIAVLFEVEV